MMNMYQAQRRVVNRCEWNPFKDRPATDRPGDGCLNEAKLSVGANGKWHLCVNCSMMPNFRRFRVRRRIITVDL